MHIESPTDGQDCGIWFAGRAVERTVVGLPKDRDGVPTARIARSSVSVNQRDEQSDETGSQPVLAMKPVEGVFVGIIRDDKCVERDAEKRLYHIAVSRIVELDVRADRS
jgi:hypothetical protein